MNQCYSVWYSYESEQAALKQASLQLACRTGRRFVRRTQALCVTHSGSPVNGLVTALQQWQLTESKLTRLFNCKSTFVSRIINLLHYYLYQTTFRCWRKSRVHPDRNRVAELAHRVECSLVRVFVTHRNCIHICESLYRKDTARRQIDQATNFQSTIPSQIGRLTSLQHLYVIFLNVYRSHASY